MNLLIYVTPPIDWFGGAHNVAIDDLGNITMMSPSFDLNCDEHEPVAHLRTDIQAIVYAAMPACKRYGWEGDLRHGHLFAYPLPREGNAPLWMVIAKQDNNGTCFIATEYAVPHFERMATESHAFDWTHTK